MFLGKNAYKKMVITENAVQGVVSFAKTNIIVRSMVVMAGNAASNAVHLSTWGIGPITQAKQARAKFIETSQYTKNQERTIKLNVMLSAELENFGKSRRIRAELQAIEDANKSLSIWPLIEAGEFSTISESLTEADQAIRDGKFADWIETATDKLPGVLKTVGKNILITKLWFRCALADLGFLRCVRF